MLFKLGQDLAKFQINILGIETSLTVVSTWYSLKYLFTVDPTTVNGWSLWTAFGPCSVTCGSYAFQSRTRSCKSPTQRVRGKHCPGLDTESRGCDVVVCPGNANKYGLNM